MHWFRKAQHLGGVALFLLCGCNSPAPDPPVGEPPVLRSSSPTVAKSADKKLEREYLRRLFGEEQAMRPLKASGLLCNVKPLSTGEVAEWAEQNGKARLDVVVAVSDTRFKAHDDDLAPLVGLSELRYLCLNGTKVTDRGLSYMAGLKKLRTLYLGDTRVTDAGLTHIGGLSELRELWLRGTLVSDVGMEDLATLTGLHSLLLDRTSLTDAGLAHLKSLKSLRSLGLSGTRVTDAGLVHLKALASLQFVDLYDTGVTDAGIATLRQWLPELKINLEPPARRH